MIIDQTNRRVLDVLENRDQQTVTEFLQKGRKSGLLEHVTEVTTDMWDGYVNAAKVAFGESVSVVIDRFHVDRSRSHERGQELARTTDRRASSDPKGIARNRPQEAEGVALVVVQES